MTIKPIVAALGAALIACGSAASAAETQIYGVVSTGLYYQKAEGADHATVGMAAYKQTPTDSHLGLMGREDLGNGWYAGFQMESGWSLDSGALYDESRLFNRLARLFVGNEFIEVSAGRMSTFSCASEPYSVFKKLRANMTGSGLPGMAPALIVYNKGESDNTIAFATRAKDGFFLQGLYTNGSNDSETEYGWSDNNHVAQVAFGWTGRQLRIGSLLNWEMPEHTDATQARKHDSFGFTILGSWDFGGPAVSAILYKGKNDWRIGGAPDLGAILLKGSGVNNLAQSTEGLDVTTGFVSFGYPYGFHYFSAGLGVVNAEWNGVSAGMKHTKGTAAIGSLMYYYNLSKRTQLYAGASYANGHDLLDGVDRFNQVFASGGLTDRF